MAQLCTQMEVGLQNKKKIGLIPVRLESRRLPGKALLDLDGYPIIIHTAKRACLSKMLDEVYVCTDNDLIIEACNKYKIKSIKTKSNFNNGTERISSVANQFNDSLIIDIQGDEPLINPLYIDELIEKHISHPAKPDIIIPTIEVDYDSPNTIVRVLISKSGRVLYLTRSRVPHNYINNQTKVKKHVSVISFEASALQKYSRFEKTNYEKIEDIELLRAVENDMKVYSIDLKGGSFSIDVNDDYIKAKIMIADDKIRDLY